MFKETLKYVEIFYRGVAGSDMSCDEFEELCREPRKVEDYNYL